MSLTVPPSQWSTYTEVLSELAADGVHVLPLPKYACPGSLNEEDINRKDSTMIDHRIVQYRAWKDYIDQRRTYVSQILIELNNEMSSLLVQGRKAAKNRAVLENVKAPSKDTIDEDTKSNDRYMGLLRQQQHFEQLQAGYECRITLLSGALQTLSRMITLRGQDIFDNRDPVVRSNAPERF
jgi:hypothetical protein